MRIALERLLHLKGETVHALPHIGQACRGAQRNWRRFDRHGLLPKLRSFRKRPNRSLKSPPNRQGRHQGSAIAPPMKPTAVVIRSSSGQPTDEGIMTNYNRPTGRNGARSMWTWGIGVALVLVLVLVGIWAFGDRTIGVAERPTGEITVPAPAPATQPPAQQRTEPTTVPPAQDAPAQTPDTAPTQPR